MVHLKNEAKQIRKLSEQGYGNDLEPSVWVPKVCGKLPKYRKPDNANERQEPWSFLEEGLDGKHLLLRLDDDAMKQMISSTRQESAACEGDIPKGAGVVASLIYDGLEYLDGEDMVTGRHPSDSVTDGRLTREGEEKRAEASGACRVHISSNQNSSTPHFPHRDPCGR